MSNLSPIGLQNDIDQLRAYLHKINDEQLLHFGKSAKYLCTPAANHGAAPRKCFMIQLEEARREWRRRRLINLATTH